MHVRRGEAQAHLLVRTNGTSEQVPPGWEAHPVSLEELTLAYMRDPDAAALPGPRARGRSTDRGKELSAATLPARAGNDESLRPLPWRRMAWVTWRQHRLTLAGVVALLGAAAVYLLITGLQMHDAYASVAACRPANSRSASRWTTTS